MEDLNKALIEDVRAFHSAYYVPNNATLVIVGDFDAKETLALAAKYFGGIPKSPQPVPRVTVTEPAQKALAESTKVYKTAPLAAVVEAFKLPPMDSPDRYALEIASSILSDGQSSRLYKRLVYDEQTAVAAFGQAQFLEGPSYFFGAAIANRGKNIKEVQTSFQFVLDQMKKEPVTADELAKAKNKLLASFITGRETMQSKADGLGQAAVQLGDPEKFNTEIENYRKVTAADVQRVCQKYLTTANETRLWVKPGGGQ